jgi:uncharacterized membrane protein
MMEPSPAAINRGVPRPPAPIQFYSVEIMLFYDGRMSVGVGARICETVDFELVNMDVAYARVDAIDQALAVIRRVVASTMPNRHRGDQR